MKKLLIAALFLGLFFNENTAFAQTETSGRTGVYRATHTKSTELKHTKLRVNFNFEKEQMTARFKIDRKRWGITYNSSLKDNSISDAIGFEVILNLK